MNSIPKFLATVVVFVVAILVCIGLIFSGIMVGNARTHHNAVISEIENSYFDEYVIAERIDKAEEKGYLLSIVKEKNFSGAEYYRVELYYSIALPLFGKVHSSKLVGYAYPGASFESEGMLGEADHYFEIDAQGTLGIKAAYRWATGVAEYASDNGSDAAGTKNNLLPTEIVIPTYFDGVEVKALRDYMFANCEDLTKLTFEEGVQVVGDYAFQNCVNLAGNVAAADSITDIGEYAFDNCAKLDAMTFDVADSQLATVGDYAFQNCVKFTDVVMPDSMVENGFGAFKGCNNMTSYKAPFVGGFDDISYVYVEIDGVEKKVYPTSIGYIFGAVPTEEVGS